jgi:dTDP-4-dehydrorhamnose 3,5-epimerase
MRFCDTPLAGVWVIEPERLSDERGFFARVFCADELTRRGLASNIVQCSISYNEHRGTLRGLHWQDEPHGEEKWVRCTMGAVFDVAVDVRADSPTFKRWFSVELTAENRKQLYLPRGVAHGFQTLSDRTELHYQISQSYRPELQRGARWNDPAFNVEWPLEPSVISPRDAAFPSFSSAG